MSTFERDITVLDYDPEQQGLRRPVSDTKADAQRLLEGIAEQRAELLSLPSDEAGLDMVGVEKFLEAQGLRDCDHLIVGPANFNRFKELHQGFVSRLGLVEGHAGMYNEMTDLAIVYRRPDYEHWNGAVFTESILVHEKAHGSNAHDALTLVRMPDGSRSVSWQARLGFLTQAAAHQRIRGEFFEEAFAERQAAAYRRTTGHYRGRSRAFDLTVPDEYVHRVGRKPGYVIEMEALAAIAFEHLCELRPGLNARMHASRESIAGVAKFARILNRLEPGLYAELRAVPRDHEAFVQAFRRVMEVCARHRSQRPAGQAIPRSVELP